MYRAVVKSFTKTLKTISAYKESTAGPLTKKYPSRDAVPLRHLHDLALTIDKQSTVNEDRKTGIWVPTEAAEGAAPLRSIYSNN